MEYLTLLAHYLLWASVYYAGVVYPIVWFRRNYRVRIVRRPHALLKSE